MKILVINTVGLNLAYLGCYGNEWIATPNIDRLASEAVTFDQHYVATPEIESPLDDWLTQTCEALERLDHVDGVVRLQLPSLAPPWTMPDELLTAYTEDDEIEPWPDPPAGKLADDEGVLRVQDTYAAAVTWFDAQLGRFLDELATRSWADELLLVFTSLAGYPLGEHDRIGWDRPWLHEEVVHVPLIIRLPGRRFAGLRIEALTQPADLAVAFDGWANRTPDDLMNVGGVSGLISGATTILRPHAFSSWQLGGRSEAAVRTLEWALIVPQEHEANDPPRPRQLYVKPDDRWEVNSIADREYEIADTLEQALRSRPTTSDN